MKIANEIGRTTAKGAMAFSAGMSMGKNIYNLINGGYRFQKNNYKYN